MQSATKRFYRRAFPRRPRSLEKPFQASTNPLHAALKTKDDLYRGVIDRVQIVMNNPRGCDEKYPRLDMDESCEYTYRPSCWIFDMKVT